MGASALWDSQIANGGIPATHAASHTDGTDDIQNATNAQKGLATAAQITDLEGNTAARHGVNDPNTSHYLKSETYTKTEVNTIIDPVLKAPEAYDPTITGNYPLTYGGAGIQKSDTFRITANQAAIGDGARSVNVEDLLIALTDSPSATVSTDWMVAESNRDQATETVKGVAELATQAEADAGTNDTNIITPLKLASQTDFIKIQTMPYFSVNQATHGLAVLDSVYHNGTIWVKGKADSENTISTHVVVSVEDTDNFHVAASGRFAISSHGLTVGEYYFLSDATAGLLTLTEPTTSGNYKLTVLKVEDANIVQIYSFPAVEVI